MNEEELVQFFELLYVLESQMLLHGMERDISELFKKLEGKLEEMDKKPEKYLSQDLLFHQAFFKACRNSFLGQDYDKIYSIIETMLHYFSISNQSKSTSLKDHRVIGEKVSTGQIEVVVKFLEGHIVSWS